MAGTVAVELRNLHFFVNQGLYEEELLVENELLVDVLISYTTPKKIIEHIDETVNYAVVYQILKEEFSERKKLLETCAMQLCNRIAGQFPFIEEISISIQKVNPPIVNFTGSVGIRYTERFK